MTPADKNDKSPKPSSAPENFGRLRRTILLRVLLLPFIILMLICGTLVYYFADNLFAGVKAELTGIAENHSRIIEQFLSERVKDLQYVVDAHRLSQIDNDKALAEIFQHLHRQSKAFFDLGVFDKAGNHIAYYGPYRLAGKNYAEAPWFQAVQKKTVYISDVFLGYRRAPHFIIAVKCSREETPWYLRATIDTRFFNELVESVRIRDTGEAYLINQTGVFQTPKRSGGRLMEKDPDAPLYNNGRTSDNAFLAKDFRDNYYLYATAYLDITGWRLIVHQRFMDAFHPLIQAVIVAAVMIVLGGAAVVLIAFLLATTLANRLSLAEVEKREMGSQLIMAGKLAEVGEMSAGMAHEINNPLQIMSVEHTMIKDTLDDCGKNGTPKDEAMAIIKDSFEQIGLQINRCREITHGLLKFSRKSELNLKPVDLQQLIAEAIRLVENQAQIQGISIRSAVARDLPAIESDFDQLQQVLVNLINNALYAVREEPAGEIRINAERSDDYAAVAVADNGCGIAQEDLEKIFMPFFTTKPVGQGTGLGLSTCYGIIERLGGKITVNSEPGEGTVFTVYLPLTKENPTDK